MSLLSSCTSGGCGAKIGPGELAAFLKDLPSFHDPNLLVGFDRSDDAAVYQLTPDLAVISTTDFFSPMVEDPFTFGKIAAANAMSDVYAMGGQVRLALNLVCFPQSLDKSILAEILAGGAEKILEAGAVLGGGHSIYDHEIKYGLAVTGTISPKAILRNNSCQVGDCLILTKGLGVGLVMSALRGGEASPEAVAAATASMERLNRYAAEKLGDYQVHACTDITGFGLLVHASEMVGENTLLLDTDQIPLLPGALTYAEEYLFTAAGQRNRQYLAPNLSMEGLSPALEEVLFDPQTSGGLLISVAEKDAAALLAAIQQDDPVAALIGQVLSKGEHPLIIL